MPASVARKEVRERAGDHGPEAEARQIVLTIGCEGAMPPI